MAKGKSAFNFAESPAAKEIDDAMQTVAQPEPTSDSPTFKRRRYSDKSWKMIQARMGNDLYARMIDFCHRENTSIQEFVTVAVRDMLDRVGKQ